MTETGLSNGYIIPDIWEIDGINLLLSRCQSPKKSPFSLVFVVFTIIASEVLLAVIAQTQKINRQQSVQPNRPQIVTLLTL